MKKIINEYCDEGYNSRRNVNQEKFQSTGFLFFPLQVLSVVLLVEDLLLAGLVFWLSVILHRSS